jgi:hypothetical protein
MVNFLPVDKIRSWYGKYERPISSISLIGGFVFDAVTLKRVDLFWENIWVVGHLLIVAVCMVWIHALEDDDKEVSKTEAVLKAAADPQKAHFWLVNILQFFFGGILSTYLVFYFRSADILTAWPFLLLLVISFAANEMLKRSFVRLSFQVAQFFLSVFAFAIYLLPILLHKIGDGVFILSGLVSLIFISLFLWVIKKASGGQFSESRLIIYGLILGIYAIINTFYFTKLLPPIPLSLKDAGIYYSIQKNLQGDYIGVTQEKPWTEFFKLYPKFDYLPGQPIFIYSAVFSPSNLNLTIVHEWQHKDALGKWVTVNTIPLKLVGGRDGGFRTYSQKNTGLANGQWRVNIKTTTGQTIGTVRFSLEAADALPKIEQKINN